MDLAQRRVHQRSSSCTRAVHGTAYHSSCSPRRAGEGEEGQSRAVAREMLMRTLFSGRWSMALRIWVCCWASALLWVYRALICKVGREARVWCGRDSSRRRCSKGIAASSCFLALSTMVCMCVALRERRGIYNTARSHEQNGEPRIVYSSTLPSTVAGRGLRSTSASRICA